VIRRRAALGALGALGASAVRALAGPPPASGTAADDHFEFVALGDMPYGPDLIAGPAYRALIDLVNLMAPPFTIHVGDFKDGLADCSDDEYTRQWQYFQRFHSALVYTPGDNDWIDCQRRGDDPLERLATLRRRFFASAQSLGQHPIALQRQAELMPAHSAYVENQRWQYRGVVFASFHTVGPDNGASATRAAWRDEWLAREAANAAWISAAFAQATQLEARALVLATQAETLKYDDPIRLRGGLVTPGFATSVSKTLLPLAEAARFPVLLIHGDWHNFVTDRPFSNAQRRSIRNLWRLQVFGEPRIHAVRVRMQLPAPGARQAQGAAAEPFRFTPIWNPLSHDSRMRRFTGS
jgi:hypothetical protein